MALLAGMIWDDRGRPMSPTHTKNHGRRYTYYASNMNDDAEAPALRLPAGEIEQSIRRAMAQWLRANANMREQVTSRSADEKKGIFARAAQLAAEVEQLPVNRASEVLTQLSLQVTVSENEIDGSFEPAAALGVVASIDTRTIKADFKIALVRRNYGHESRMRLQPLQADRVVRDDRLIELLGRSFTAREELLQMDEKTIRSTKSTRLRHLQRLARLSYLDPNIIRSILNGSQPQELNPRNLWRMADLPIRFVEQGLALGFPTI